MKNYTSITYNAKDFTTDLQKVPKILNRNPWNIFRHIYLLSQAKLTSSL